MAASRYSTRSHFFEIRPFAPVNEDNFDSDETQPPTQEDTQEEIHTTNALQTPSSNGLTSGLSKRRRGRGKSRNLIMCSRVGQDLPPARITFLNGRTRPVGEWAKQFATEIGVICHNFAPITVGYYSKMTEAQKESLYHRLQSRFEIDFQAPGVKKSIDDFFAARFRAWKYRMHRHFQRHKNNFEAARKNPYPDVSMENWQIVCDMFQSREFKVRSDANKCNRSKVLTNHRAGSKSFARLRYEMRDQETQEEPDRVTFYKHSHYKESTGTWVTPECERRYMKMLEYQKEAIEVEASGGTPLTTDEIANKVLHQKRSSYIVGLGYGYHGITSTQRTKIEIEEAHRSAKEAQNRASNLEAQVEEQRSMLQEQRSFLQEQMQVQKQQLQEQQQHITEQQERIQMQNDTIATLQSNLKEFQSMMQTLISRANLSSDTLSSTPF